jgi:hypothetical protein
MSHDYGWGGADHTDYGFERFLKTGKGKGRTDFNNRERSRRQRRAELRLRRRK